MKHTILCVDDERDNVEALERIFRKKYKVLKATSGKEALELLDKQSVSLIISDQRMPGMTGVEFLTKSLKTHPESVRILLTGYTDIESVIAAINSGQIYRYVTKPWDPRELEAAVDRAIERYEMAALLKEKNAELEKALKELKSLDEAKSHFMILINHELKTPLTTLMSYLELLSETKLDEDQKLYTERLNKSTERLKEIIFDVLDFVSAETGQTKISAKRQSVKPAIEKVIQQLDGELESRKQKVELKFELDKLVFDEKHFTNILERLLHNASKFGSEKSKIKIKITEEDDSRAKLSIINEGRPLSKDTISKILKPFALDENIMNHSKGIGMGLSISQALLKLHGSHLEIESEDKLTTVSFSLDK